eukprot:TRINITY_DN8071_c0_g2_i1.p1 TRINITY_DN8071_c0_g2~~TRINITY_DN8071_c0_g2_i1.p1  ORF type:complete len:1022 (+),score=240.84 TRINITY_DN8071_c0_g2_i1:1250-4315(+)
MLLETDCRAGVPGAGGMGGAGGAGGNGGWGGNGGFPGQGGRGGPAKHDREGNIEIYPGDSGSTGGFGCRGNSGYNGAPGNPGRNGKEGRSATPGSAVFVVVDAAGNTIESSPKKYNPEVTHYTVRGEIDDGVFEPNEFILISDVTIVNTGGLTLPAGFRFQFASTPTVGCGQEYILPSLAPGGVFVIPYVFRGRIFDVPSPARPGPFLGCATFESSVDLWGRWIDSSILATRLVVQYPIKFQDLSTPLHLGENERGVVELKVVNISNMTYTKAVVVNVDFGSNIIPFNPESTDPLGSVLTFPLDELKPGEVKTIRLEVQLANETELFTWHEWKVTLNYNGKNVEWNHRKIRKSPIYSPNLKNPTHSADILLFTSAEIDQTEYLAYKHLFNSLQLSFDLWDIERYRGISWDGSSGQQHELQWQGRYENGTLVLPYARKYVGMITGTDILNHFYGPRAKWPTLLHNSNVIDETDSAILFIGIQNLDQLVQSVIDAGPSFHFVGKEFSGKHILKPEWNDVVDKGKKLAEKLGSRDTNHQYQFNQAMVKFQEAGLTRWWYGRAEIHQVLLPNYSRLLCLTDDLANHIQTPTSAILNVGSPFFEALVAIVSCLGAQRRVQMFLTTETHPYQVFQLPNNNTFGWCELLTVSFFNELRIEWKSTSRLPLRRLAQFVIALQQNKDKLSVTTKTLSTEEGSGDQPPPYDRRDGIAINLYAMLMKFHKDVVSFFDAGLLKDEFLLCKKSVEQVLFPGSGDAASRLKILQTRSQKMARSSLSFWSSNELARVQFVLETKVPLVSPTIQLNSVVWKEGTEPSSEFDALLQQWQHDSEVEHCGKCEAGFSLFTRKHHCRKCGKIFCNDCTKKRVLLEGQSELSPLRVCDFCYQQETSTMWESEKQVEKCRLCDSSFNVFKWKYNCFNCGKIFCKDCSKKKIFLPRFGEECQVCNSCFDHIFGQKWEEESPSCSLCEGHFGVNLRRFHCKNCGKEFCDNCSNIRYLLPHQANKGHSRVCKSCFTNLAGFSPDLVN